MRAVLEVLGITQIGVKKDGWHPLTDTLGRARIKSGLGADPWFGARPDLAMHIELIMKPSVFETK